MDDCVCSRPRALSVCLHVLVCVLGGGGCGRYKGGEYNNPFTGAQSCPPGYQSIQYGRVMVYDLPSRGHSGLTVNTA